MFVVLAVTIPAFVVKNLHNLKNLPENVAMKMVYSYA